MQALAARDLGLGHGQHLDVSILEATVATMIYETVTFQSTGIVRGREGKRFAVGPFMIVTLKCKDGYAGLHCVTDKQFEGLCDLMGRRELASDSRFNSALNRMLNNNALLEIVEEFFIGRERKWLYREGQRRAIPLVPIPSVAEVLEWEQTRARDYFETIDDPVLGKIARAGDAAALDLASRASVAPRAAARRAQSRNLRRTLGTKRQRDRDIEKSGHDMKTVFDRKVRVLDISMGWAGPLVGQMFAEMGAEVIKVEDTNHFDWWRGSLSMAPPEMQPIERASVFNTANRGKRGVTLDLTDARGIEILKRLIEVGDILIENFSPGVMDRLGLGYQSVSAINPRMIMISMPSFGSDGPECNARGYGNTVEAMAGVTGLTGYHDGNGQRYTLSNALGDPVGGLHGVFALMVALRERERTGRGQWIELAQVEALIPFVDRADARISVQRKSAGLARQPASRARAPRNLSMRGRRQLGSARLRDR